MKYAFILLFCLLTLALDAQDMNNLYPQPKMGWDKFKQNILKDNPEIDSLVHRTGILINYYQVEMNKKGKIEQIKLKDKTPIGKRFAKIIRDSMLHTQWITNLTGKKKPYSGFIYIEFISKRLNNIDSISNKDSAFSFKTERIVTLETDDDDLFDYPNSSATYAGGDFAFIDYVAQEFQYPKRCMDNGISGYVLLKFQVTADGRIVNVSAEEETAKSPEFTTEAIRVLQKSRRWIPAVYNNHYVRAWRKLPIKININ